MTTSAATDVVVLEHIAAERRALVDVLAGLPSGAWDAATLCDGWRVRELVAHMTMQFRYSVPRFIFEMARSRGNFSRMADRCARREGAQMSIDELLDALRDNIANPWKPPGGKLEGALIHDVIHGLDLTVGLGIARRVPDDARLRIVLDGLVEPQALKHFGVDLAGIQLCADDTDWTFGEGSRVVGHAQDLALVLCGRWVPADALQGDARDRFSRDS